MKIKLLFLLLLTTLPGCNPSEITLQKGSKDADKFVRAFIDKILLGQADLALNDLNPQILNEDAKEYIFSCTRNLAGIPVKKIRVVESSWMSSISTDIGKNTTYNLGYEYFSDSFNVLFLTNVLEKDGRLSIMEFNATGLRAPLSKITAFQLSGLSVTQYFFLIFSNLVPLFILFTFIILMRIKLKPRKKILWAILILMFSLPRFSLIWNTAEMDFNFFMFNIFGSSLTRSNLYSFWMLTFSIPVGAFIFWMRRRSLLNSQPQPVIVSTASEDLIDGN